MVNFIHNLVINTEILLRKGNDLLKKFQRLAQQWLVADDSDHLIQDMPTKQA